MAKRRIQVKPVGQAPVLERKPGLLARLFFFVSGLAFFASLGLGVYLIFQDLGRRVWPVLAESGWARHLQAREPLEGAIKCFFNSGCSKVVLRGPYEPNYFLGLYPVAGGLLLLAVGARLVTVRGTTKLPGTAKWAEEKDLEPLKRGRQSGYVGFLWETTPEGKPKPPKKLVPFSESVRNGHMAVIAGPGAGKTSAFFQPNLFKDARDGNSAIVFDFKYPDPTGLGEALSYYHAHGHGVYVFTPFDPMSMVLPLLEGGETREGALDIAEMLVPKRRMEGPDEFYRNLERALLTVLIYAISNDPEVEAPSPRILLRRILEGPEKIKNYISSHPRAEVREWARSFVEQISGMARDKQVGMTMGLASRFILFDNPRLSAATTRTPGAEEAVIDLKRLLQGEKPFLLYIGIPQAEIQGGKGQTLLQLVKRLIDRAILQAAHENGGKLKHHLAVYLDEFPNFGYLPNMTEMLATMRSRRVSYLISLQDRAQGYAVYGREEFDAMFGTIQTIVAWPSRLDSIDAQWFSELLGKTTALERSYAEGGQVTGFGLFERRVQETLREVERSLLTVDEMQTFPPEEAVVVTPGVSPIRAIMPFFFADGKQKGLVPHPWAKERAKALRYDPNLVLQYATLQGVVESPVLPQREDAYEALFATWVERVLATAPKVAKAKERKGYEITKLPKDLGEDFVGEWKSRGWIEAIPGGYLITEKGLKVAGPQGEHLLEWMAKADSLFHLVRKNKDKAVVSAGELPSEEAPVVIQKSTLWVREELAKELPPEALALGERKEVGGVAYYVFRLEVVPVLARS